MKKAQYEVVVQVGRGALKNEHTYTVEVELRIKSNNNEIYTIVTYPERDTAVEIAEASRLAEVQALREFNDPWVASVRIYLVSGKERQVDLSRYL